MHFSFLSGIETTPVSTFFYTWPNVVVIPNGSEWTAQRVSLPAFGTDLGSDGFLPRLNKNYYTLMNSIFDSISSITFPLPFQGCAGFLLRFIHIEPMNLIKLQLPFPLDYFLLMVEFWATVLKFPVIFFHFCNWRVKNSFFVFYRTLYIYDNMSITIV